MRVERNISRRELLAGALQRRSSGRSDAAGEPKIAAITTTYFKYSHAQHIVDRFLEGYGWNGTHHHPPMDLVSLYVDQIGDRDLSQDRAERFPAMKIYPTIAEALTLGGSKLAVDGVVLVGEHGKYPRNEKGQTKYPALRVLPGDRQSASAPAAAPCRSSTTSICPGTGIGRRRCTTRSRAWASASWPDPACR